MESPSGIRASGCAGDSWRVGVVAETGSTNDDLLVGAESGALADRTVLRTEHQTAGRGRLDRRWDAPPGSNLLASIYFADPGPQPGALVQRVGLAVVGAVDAVRRTGAPGEAGAPVSSGAPVLPLSSVGLKWPNDVLLDGRKLAGVLAQRSTSSAGLVVGFGVNVGWAPEGAARVGELADCTPAELLDAVLAAYDRLPVSRAAVAEMYRARLVTLGQRVRVELPGDVTFVGEAADLDADGRLVVVSEQGDRRVFDVGDVVHLRPASPRPGLGADLNTEPGSRLDLPT